MEEIELRTFMIAHSPISVKSTLSTALDKGDLSWYTVCVPLGTQITDSAIKGDRNVQVDEESSG